MHYSPVLESVLLAGILAATLFGWLSLWAAADRFRWYWHVAPLALALAALVPMGGREPVLLFGTQAGLIIACEVARKSLGQRRAGNRHPLRPKFGIGDAIMVLALTGGVMAIVRFQPVQLSPTPVLTWWRWIVSGAGFAFATLSGAVLVTGRRRGISRLAIALPFSLSAIVLLLVGDPKEGAFPYRYWAPSGVVWSMDWALVLLGTQSAATAAWLLLLQWSGWSWWPAPVAMEPAERSLSQKSASRLLRWPSRVMVVVGSACVAWGVADAYRTILPPFTMPEVELPELNGVDDLETVDRKINWQAIPLQDLEAADDQACGQLVRDNLEPLRLIRESLEKPWMRSMPNLTGNQQVNCMVATRSWHWLLLADARYQLATGRPDAAARDCLDILRLADLAATGGLVSEDLMTCAIAQNAQTELAEHLDRFDPPSLREIAYTIELLDSTREPVDAFEEREKLLVAVQRGWLERLTDAAFRRQFGEDQTRSIHHTRDKVQCLLRLTATEAAIRAYAIEHGSPPDSLDSLVPQYFTALPLDPLCRYEDAPFIYRRDGDRYLLYSVGIDGYDDGGLRTATPDPRRGEKRDLYFDSTLP